MEKDFQSFEEFWPFYLSQHSNKICRNLHVLGTTLALCYFAFCLGSGIYGMIPLTLVIGYGFAWIGHFVFEKNRPATFKYPKWSFISDFKMLSQFYLGTLNQELEKYNLSASNSHS